MSNDRYLSILEEIKKHGGEVDRKPNDKVLIIDGLNTFIRTFSAIPTTNDDGVHVGGIVGFLKSVGYAVKTLGPTRTILFFDGKGGSNRRRKIYPEYKNKRKLKIRLNRTDMYSSSDDEHQSMLMQLARGLEYFECLPLTILTLEGTEADDVIAYTAEQVLSDSEVIIMRTDKDFLHLVDDRVRVWSPTKKKLYNKDKLLEEYGIPAHNFLMYRMIEGDKSDNIGGINGIGIKTLLKKMPVILKENKISIDELIDGTDDERLKSLLDKEILERNYKLMQLFDVDISDSDKLKISKKIHETIPMMNKSKFRSMFLEDKLYGTLPNLDTWLMTNWNKLNKYADISDGKKA